MWAADRPSQRPNILFALADDWTWPVASIAGDPVVKTPTFDSLARRGVMFTNAYVAAPSCSPSRAAMLTGQWHWRLEEGANLLSTLAAKFSVYPDLLEKSGYHAGFTRKGWGPGSETAGARTRNPAGPRYKISRRSSRRGRRTNRSASGSGRHRNCPTRVAFLSHNSRGCYFFPGLRIFGLERWSNLS